jgi:hypothetical protein
MIGNRVYIEQLPVKGGADNERRISSEKGDAPLSLTLSRASSGEPLIGNIPAGSRKPLITQNLKLSWDSHWKHPCRISKTS